MISLSQTLFCDDLYHQTQNKSRAKITTTATVCLPGSGLAIFYWLVTYPLTESHHTTIFVPIYMSLVPSTPVAYSTGSYKQQPFFNQFLKFIVVIFQSAMQAYSSYVHKTKHACSLLCGSYYYGGLHSLHSTYWMVHIFLSSVKSKNYWPNTVMHPIFLLSWQKWNTLKFNF